MPRWFFSQACGYVLLALSAAMLAANGYYAVQGNVGCYVAGLGLATQVLPLCSVLRRGAR